MKTIISTLLFIIFLQLKTSAQYTINGTIKGATNATVSIGSIDKSVATDSSGIFTFTDVPKGFYTLEISSIGYQTKLVNIQLPSTNNSIQDNITIASSSTGIELNIILQPNTITINDVVVSGVRTSLQQNSCQPTEVLDMKSMQERGQLTVMEAIASKPGISLITTGPGIARPVIRGLSGNRIATIINGVKLENQQWDMEHTLGLNQYGIDRVEIIKGPSTFLYGSDAMGGVLDFIDEKPAPLNKLVGDISGGFNSNTFGTVSDVGLKGTKEHISWSLRAGLNNSSDYYDANFNRVANSRFREFLGKATLGLNYKKSVTLFSYQMNMGYYGIVEPFESDSGKTEEEDHPMEFENPYHTLMHQTALAKNTLLLGNTKLISTFSFQNDQRKELEPGDTEKNPFLGLNLNVVSLDVKADHSFSDHVSLIIGAQGGYQANSNSGYSRLIPDYQQQDMAVYAVNRYNLLSNKLKVDLGIRYDQRNIKSDTYGIKDSADYMPSVDKQYNNTSFSAGFNFAPTENLIFYSNIGTGYRAPNMAELTSNGVRLETQRYEIGNSSFNKETNMQADAGFIVSGKQASLEVSGFYNHINNYIFTTARGDSLKGKPVYAFQQNDAWIYGAETKLTFAPYSIKWFSFTSSYGMLQGYQSGGSYLPMMPPYKITNEFTFRKDVFQHIHHSFLRLGITNVWSQERIASTEISTPAYNLVNVACGGDFHLFKQTFIVSVGVNNALNEKYYDHLSRLRIYNVYNIGLNAFINIKVPFNFDYK